MKTINFITKSILSISILMLTFSCEKEESLSAEEENILIEDDIQQIGIPEEEWNGETANLSQKNLISSVSGSNYRRFYVDVNYDRVPDLVAIKTRNTGTRRTEVHILDGKTGYNRYLVQTGTALPQVGSNFDFAIGVSRNGGIMIYAIKKSNTGTRSTEIHVISSKLGYNRFYSQNGTQLPETNRAFSFRLRTSGHRYLHHIEVFHNGNRAGVLNAFTTFRSFL